MKDDHQRAQIRADMEDLIKEARRQTRRDWMPWLLLATALVVAVALLPVWVLK